MKRSLFLLTFAVAMLAHASLPAAERPNIIIIVADDLGYADVPWHGCSYRMPHLDALAKAGLKLETHYVFPVCSPTRAALLSGRYASRFGCTGPTNEQVFPFSTVTLASALKSVGYETALTGKWHLGSKPEQRPNLFGFDHSYGALAGGLGPYVHRYKPGPFIRTWHRDGTLLDEEGHVTDLFTAEAVRFIETDRKAPFFLYVPYTAVHVPVSEPAKYLEKNSHIQNPGQRLYAADCSHLDDGVGQIVAALGRRKLLEDTLILFFSDNGAPSLNNRQEPYEGDYPDVLVGGSNGPFRGKKTQVYEGGIRTPALIHWPGRLKPGRIDVPLHVSDWMPTLCGLVGYQPPRDLKWDGRDIWPVLSGREGQPAPRTMYWLGPNKAAAVRHGDWKLITFRTGIAELYDLAADPGEKKNLAAEQPGRLAELKKRLAEQAARDNDSIVKER